MLKNINKTPFPWFGGKTHAAPLVWELLGDCPHCLKQAAPQTKKDLLSAIGV